MCSIEKSLQADYSSLWFSAYLEDSGKFNNTYVNKVYLDNFFKMFKPLFVIFNFNCAKIQVDLMFSLLYCGSFALYRVCSNQWCLRESRLFTVRYNIYHVWLTEFLQYIKRFFAFVICI